MECVRGLRKVSASVLNPNNLQLERLAVGEAIVHGTQRYWALEETRWEHRKAVYIWVQVP